MSNTIHDRIQQIVNTFAGGKNTLFASKLGVSEGNIRSYIKGTMPKADLLAKIVNSYDINPMWLLTGKGEILNSDDEQTTLIPVASPEGGIPLVPIDAWAGLLHGEISVALSECERFFVPSFKDADFLISVRGDSMSPRYQSGDLVACKFLNLSDLFFQWGKVYVLDTNQGAIIKKVRPGSTNDTITLISENPEYEPFELPRSSIYNIAIVQGVIRVE